MMKSSLQLGGHLYEVDEFAKELIHRFGMEILPIEGGLFVQTYKSSETIPVEVLPERYNLKKAFSTAILYLYTADRNCFSAMHRLPTDEVYHFYLGEPVEMLLLYPDGKAEHVILGQDIFAGQRVQFVAPRGVWQGSHLLTGGRFALIGTTMAPGYEDDDYEAGVREELIALFPHERNLISRLTRLPGNLPGVE